MARVTKDTMIGDLLQIDQNVAPLLLNIGMHCLGCPSSQMETVSYTHLTLPSTSRRQRQMCIRDSHHRWRQSKRLLWFTDLTRMILSLKSTHSSITTSVNLRKDGLLMQAVFYLQSIFC